MGRKHPARKSTGRQNNFANLLAMVSKVSLETSFANTFNISAWSQLLNLQHIFFLFKNCSVQPSHPKHFLLSLLTQVSWSPQHDRNIFVLPKKEVES